MILTVFYFSPLVPVQAVFFSGVPSPVQHALYPQWHSLYIALILELKFYGEYVCLQGKQLCIVQFVLLINTVNF